jgi:cellulose synthase (UDP-forming)
LYRVVAWQQIGGFQDSIHDDHLTSMSIHGTLNPYSGKSWRSIYTPDVVVLNPGPTSWNEYFEQQQRSVYVIWEMILYHDLRLDKRLRPGQGMYYSSLLYFFPSLVTTWIIGNIISVLFFIFGIVVMSIPDSIWVLYWCLSLGSQFYLFMWLSKFNLNDYEREHGSRDAIVLTLISLPVYVYASLQSILGRPFVSLIRANNNRNSDNPLSAFRLHMRWGLFLVAVLLFGLINTGAITGQLMWLLFALSITLLPCAVVFYRQRFTRTRQVHELQSSRYVRT